MLQLLILLLVIFVLWPIARAVWMVYKLRRQARKAFEQFGQQQEAYRRRQEAEHRPAGWQPAPQRKKIIGKDQGEYVEWEEVTVTVETTTTENSSERDVKNRTAAEPQISDAEWEDIK